MRARSRKVCILSKHEANWIPPATVPNCAHQERPERRISLWFFLEVGGWTERGIEPGATRLLPTTSCPLLSAGTDGNLGHDTCPSQLKTGHQQRAGGPSPLWRWAAMTGRASSEYETSVPCGPGLPEQASVYIPKETKRRQCSQAQGAQTDALTPCSPFSPPDHPSPIQLNYSARVFKLSKGKKLYVKQESRVQYWS